MNLDILATQHYIILSNGNLKLPIVFTQAVNHKTISGPLLRSMPQCKVDSAGCCYLALDNNQQLVYKVYGRADSLEIVSQPEDSLILNEILLGI